MRYRTKWLLFGAGFGFVVVLAFLLGGAFGDARATARRSVCVHNLKLLAAPLKAYAEEHDGRFPDKVSDLYFALPPDNRDYLAGILICPERGAFQRLYPEPTPEDIDSLSSYAVVPGLALGDDKDEVIAYEKEDNHSGAGRSVLYVDGRAFFVSLEDRPAK